MTHIITEPTCFKGENHTWIDLILTKQKQLLMKFRTFIMSISDFHALTTSIKKLLKIKPLIKLNFVENIKILTMIYLKLT